MKKYLIIGFILLIVCFPMIEGFENCIVDTLANLKNEVSKLQTEVTEMKSAQNAQSESAKSAQSKEKYKNLNKNLPSAMSTFN